MPDTQYFTNIDGKYVKDAEARQQLNDLEDYVESLDQPWTPLQDGYSNFWFELTNDTLSPWLNFSAKTENAVIDWGDGSGEVALDTLTPTHTYAKAGRYVVKVKGVTGIGVQNPLPSIKSGKYSCILQYVELNSDVVGIASTAFRYSYGLKQIIIPNNPNIVIGNNIFSACSSLLDASLPNISSLPASTFNSCGSLDTVTIPNTITTLDTGAFSYCPQLKNISIPSNVASIGNTCFSGCSSLAEIHCLPTTPPTLGTNVFGGLPASWICYVPVGYAETYKSASGWSTYADHILEEGQQPNRAMLAKFNSAKTDEPQDDMR